MAFKIAQSSEWFIGSVLVFLYNYIIGFTRPNIKLCFPSLGDHNRKKLIKNVVRQDCITDSTIPVTLVLNLKKTTIQY